MVGKKLIKASFIQKLVRQRLDRKYNITDISFEEMEKLYAQYKEILYSIGLEMELSKTEPITKLLYTGIRNDFIARMKSVDLIPEEATMEEIDMEYINAILESFLYSHKVYLYCTVIDPDKKFVTIKELSSIKGPFIKAGIVTLLDMAMLYSNNYDSWNIPNIGPVKYKKFQDFFVLNFGINVVE